METAREEEFIALEFKTREGFTYCLDLLINKRPDIPFDLPGRDHIIIPRKELHWFKSKFKVKYYKFSLVRVIPMKDVPPEKRGRIRARYGRPTVCEYGDIRWKKARIEELRKKLGLEPPK